MREIILDLRGFAKDAEAIDDHPAAQELLNLIFDYAGKEIKIRITETRNRGGE